MKTYEAGKVQLINELAPQIFDMTVKLDHEALAVPGQFSMIYPKDKSTLLPRPISICEVNGDTIRFVFRIAGKGTAEFASYKEGDLVKLLSPLGNGYDVESMKGKKVLVMGGGIGIPPMLELFKVLKREGIECSSLFGYRDNKLFLKEDFDKVGETFIATEDGSVGVKGNVLNAIEELKLEADVICACGPMPMLRAIKNYAESNGIVAYISLEERMACGVGACLGCVTKTKNVDHHSHVNNARVCTEGPVFDSREVDI